MRVIIRPAQTEDVVQIIEMVNRFAAQNVMLPRSETNVHQTLADWLVAVAVNEDSAATAVEWITQNEDEAAANSDAGDDATATDSAADTGEESKVVGCGALVPLNDTLVEIRSLAIDESQHGQGLGSELVVQLVDLARTREYKEICALTLRPKFFTRLGFAQVDRWSISPKVWQACIYCPKFHRCDEVAVLMNLEQLPVQGTEKERHQPPGWNRLLKWGEWQPLRLAYQHQDREQIQS